MAAAKKGFPTIVIVLLVVGLLIVAAGAYFILNKGGSMGGMMQGSNAITSIKDALTKSVSMECEYEADGTKTMAWIKNGAIRADVSGGNTQNNGSMIMKDSEKKMWFWNEKEGWVMDIPDSKDVEGTEQESNSPSQDIMKDLEEYKDHCKPAVVSDSKFNPPMDVKFTNMSDMMNGNMDDPQVKKMMEQYNTEGSPEDYMQPSEDSGY